MRPEAPDGVESRWYWDTPLVASSHVDGRIYVASERVYRSDDRGINWTAISGDLTKHLDRDTIPVMGQLWPENAVWKHVFTAALSTIVSLDESPLDPNLLVAGTDDGWIHVTEDGGTTWRRVDGIPGVPEYAYVTDVEASRHDTDVIYATLSNRKRGDFRPYVVRSDDRGNTWSLISNGVGSRDPVWSIVEDDEDPGVLFLGAEFGLYVSIDGGGSWVRFDGGLPTIQVRELDLQAREDDLVLATFGRGFWVVDDISFFREAAQVTESTPAHLFPVRGGNSFRTDLGTGGPAGSQHWQANNPPYGITFTVWTDPEAPQEVAIVIRRQGGGSPVQRIAIPESGLRRLQWDLTEVAQTPAGRGTGGRGGGGGRGRGGRGGREVRVESGLFEAAIVRESSTGDVVLTPWRDFQVTPLPIGGS